MMDGLSPGGHCQIYLLAESKTNVNIQFQGYLSWKYQRREDSRINITTLGKKPEFSSAGSACPVGGSDVCPLHFDNATKQHN